MKKKKSNGKSKRRESLSPVIAPSSPIDTTDNAQNRSIHGAPRITTTSVTAKNIRHRTISSSSITTIVNKKSIVSTTAAISKRQTVKTMCHIISYPWHVFRFFSFLFFSFLFFSFSNKGEDVSGFFPCCLSFSPYIYMYSVSLM
jgi:hypothetical protein